MDHGAWAELVVGEYLEHSVRVPVSAGRQSRELYGAVIGYAQSRSRCERLLPYIGLVVDGKAKTNEII